MDEKTIARLRAFQISPEVCKELLKDLESTSPPERTQEEKLEPAQIDGVNVLEIDQNFQLKLSKDHCLNALSEVFEDEALSRLVLEQVSSKHKLQKNSELFWTKASLRDLGELLLPLCSLGILNGGAATSYFDQKKNQAFAPELFSRNQKIFEASQEKFQHLPKGVCPAWFNPNSEEGPSFFYDKLEQIHARLADSLSEWHKLSPQNKSITELCLNSPLVFQMSSKKNSRALSMEFEKIYTSESLERIQTFIPDYKPMYWEELQELAAALDRSPDGKIDIYWTAFGKKDNPLALPLGHGQVFKTLKPIFERLNQGKKKFIFLGNIDNLAYSVNPSNLAYLALTASPASFEFSKKTVLDTKGGILLKSLANSKLLCGDIGQRLSPQTLSAFEAQKKDLLFNCACGLFSLPWLLEHLDTLITQLPIHLSEQNKDAGHYWQAEQNMWDSLALIPGCKIIVVKRNERFIPAKLFADTLCISLSNIKAPYPQSPERILWEEAKKMHSDFFSLRKRSLN